MSYTTNTNNIVFTANLTFKKISDASTLTLKICSKEIPYLAYDDEIIYPLIKEVSRLTEQHDTFLPTVSEGSITIDNSLDCFGFQRRFGDLLDFYTLTEQDIIIDVRSYTEEETTHPTASQQWAFQISQLDFDLEKEDLKIRFKNSFIRDKVITKEINPSDFPYAPNESLGKYLPLVIGEDVKVLGVPINTSVLGLCSVIDGYSAGSVNYNYIFDGSINSYLPFLSASSTSAYVVSNSWDSNDLTVSLGKGVVFPIQRNDFVDSRDGILIHSLDLYLKGTGAAAAEGTISVSIAIFQPKSIDILYMPPIPFEDVTSSRDFTSLSEDELVTVASCSINKSDWISRYTGTGSFYQTFEFEKPIRIGKDLLLNDTLPSSSPLTHYFIVVKDSDSTTTPVSYIAKSDAIPVWSYIDDGLAVIPPPVPTGLGIFFRCLGVTITTGTTTFDSNGLGSFYVTLATATRTLPFNYFLNNFVFDIDGLKSGATLLNTPDLLLPAILDSGTFDSTSLSDTHDAYTDATYGRVLSGQTQGKTSRLQFLSNLMKNSGSRLISTASKGEKKVALFAYGADLEPSYVLNDTRIKSLKLKELNRTTVINNITANYKKDVLTFNTLDIESQRNQAGYSRVLGNQRKSGSQSITLYGQNDLANSGFDLVGDETSMTGLINYYLNYYEHPERQIEIAINYDPADELNELLAGERIQIITAKLPAFYGTATKPLPIYDASGDEVTEAFFGKPIRAKTYTCEIISKSLAYQRNKTELVLDLKIV